MHRSTQRHCVWDSSTAYQWVFSPVGQICLLTYPLKPSYAGEPGHIPLREIDGCTCIMIEIGKSLIPEGSEFALSIQSPTTFNEMRRVPALPNQIRKEVFQYLSCLVRCYVLIVY